MKKTRLLEIVREEIASALNEVGQSPEEQKATNLSIAAEKAKIAAAQKQLQQLQKSGVSETQLEEEQLDEMAYNIVLSNPEELAKLKDKIKDSTKKGEQLLSQVIDIIQRDKKENKPIRQRDIANELGTIQQKINPLVNLLIDYGILDKGESVTGVTKKTPSDKPKKEKPESTGKRGRPAGTKTATRTPGADGFDDVSYNEPTKSSDEDKAAAAAAKTDKVIGGKYAKELSPEEEIKYNNYKKDINDLVNQLEKKYDRSKMEELKIYLEDNEVRNLFKAKGVKLSDLVRSVVR